MMRGYYDRFGSWMGLSRIGAFFCILMMLLIIVLIVLAVIFIVRFKRRGRMPRNAQERAGNVPSVSPSLEILNQRLAKGEITTEEYQRLKSEILKQ